MKSTKKPMQLIAGSQREIERPGQPHIELLQERGVGIARMKAEERYAFEGFTFTKIINQFNFCTLIVQPNIQHPTPNGNRYIHMIWASPSSVRYSP